MKIAIKVNFNIQNGKRAGDIKSKDPALICRGGSLWQKIDNEKPENCYEIRMVEDNRDVSQYENIDGVEVLRGKEAINNALTQLETDQSAKFKMDKETILAALQDKEHPEWGDLSRITNRTLADEAEAMWQDGVPGMKKIQQKVPKL